jgi:hypothetical protein
MISRTAKIWEHEADTEVHATPAIAGDRLILGGTAWC